MKKSEPVRHETVSAMSAAECLKIRKGLGMTQDEFARAIGLKSWLSVLRWETGQVPIKPDRAFAIRALVEKAKKEKADARAERAELVK